MIAVTWVLCGLVLDIAGVLILAIGETSHLTAFASYRRRNYGSTAAWDSAVAKYPWWARPIIRVGTVIGSEKPEALADVGQLEGMATRMLGYTIIFLGFILQGMGALAALLC